MCFYRDRSKITVTSKMAFFVTYVNVWKLLTNITNVTKSFILDVAGVLDMLLFLYVNIYVKYEHFILIFILIYNQRHFYEKFVRVYMLMYIYIQYTHVYIYIYIYIIFIYMHIYIYTYIYIYIYIHVHMWIYKVYNVFIFHKKHLCYIPECEIFIINNFK